METLLAWIIGIPIGVGMVLLLDLALWKIYVALVAPLFHLPPLGYWQAVLLLFFIGCIGKLLFGRGHKA